MTVCQFDGAPGTSQAQASKRGERERRVDHGDEVCDECVLPSGIIVGRCVPREVLGCHRVFCRPDEVTRSKPDRVDEEFPQKLRIGSAGSTLTS